MFFILTEGEICEITGPAAQLTEDRPLKVSGRFVISQHVLADCIHAHLCPYLYMTNMVLPAPDVHILRHKLWRSLKLRRMRALCLIVGSALLNANIRLQIWFIYLVLREEGVQDIQLLILILAFSCYQPATLFCHVYHRPLVYRGTTHGPYVTVVWFENNMLTSLCACKALQIFAY